MTTRCPVVAGFVAACGAEVGAAWGAEVGAACGAAVGATGAAALPPHAARIADPGIALRTRAVRCKICRREIRCGASELIQRPPESERYVRLPGLSTAAARACRPDPPRTRAGNRSRPRAPPPVHRAGRHSRHETSLPRLARQRLRHS